MGAPIGWQIMSPTRRRASDRSAVLDEIRDLHPTAYEQKVSDAGYVYLIPSDDRPRVVGLSWPDATDRWSFVVVARSALIFAAEYSVFRYDDNRVRVYPGFHSEPPTKASEPEPPEPEDEPEPIPEPEPTPEPEPPPVVEPIIRRIPMRQRRERFARVTPTQPRRQEPPARPVEINGTAVSPRMAVTPQLIKRADVRARPDPTVHIAPEQDGWVVTITTPEGREIKSKPYRSYEEAAKSIPR